MSDPRRNAVAASIMRENVLDDLRKDRLKPRYHNGIGFAQVYLAPEVRLHVWHHEFPNTPEAFGTRHNHRYDFISTVLLGSMTNVTLDVRDDAGLGYFDMYEVQPAHLGSAKPTIRKPGVSVGISKIEVVEAGQSYTFPKGVYHEGRSNGVTATILKKLNQEDAWAGILAPRGQEPEHGMEKETISPERLKALIITTAEQFNDAAWINIAKALADG